MACWRAKDDSRATAAPKVMAGRRPKVVSKVMADLRSKVGSRVMAGLREKAGQIGKVDQTEMVDPKPKVG